MAHVFGSSWMVLLLVSVTVMLLQSQAVQGNGAELQKQVLARCNEIVSNQARCNRFWDNFEKAFVNKDPKTIKPEAYDELIKSEPIPVNHDKVLLWSKTGYMIKQLKNKKHFLSIGETIYGSLGSTKEWCGEEGSEEVQTSHCPDWDEHPENPSKSYWKSVSAAFAKAATGVVTVLLSGAEEKPFNEKSIFATDEVPNLQKDKVTSLRVILVNKGSSSKNCLDKSLEPLRKEWEDKYECRTATESDLIG